MGSDAQEFLKYENARRVLSEKEFLATAIAERKIALANISRDIALRERELSRRIGMKGAAGAALTDLSKDHDLMKLSSLYQNNTEFYSGNRGLSSTPVTVPSTEADVNAFLGAKRSIADGARSYLLFASQHGSRFRDLKEP